MAHTPDAVQVLVSDNASTDGTGAICREYARRASKFRYVRQSSNIGWMANFRFVLGQARTPYFMWLADDDWLGDDFVERALEFMEGHPDYVLATFGASAYYSRHTGAYQFTTLTSGVEDDNPRRRVELLLANLSDNSEFYGIYRQATMRFDPPAVVGADCITMIDTSWIGKIRTLEGTLIHRQNRWDTQDRHAAVAAGAGLPLAQGAEPHYATAIAALAHIALESPVYSGIAAEERLALAARVFHVMRRHQGLPERVQFWPDAQRLLGEAFALRHGPALRALIGQACSRTLQDPRCELPPEVLELALALNLGAERTGDGQQSGRPEPEAAVQTRGEGLEALALRAVREPAYRHPRVLGRSRIPHELIEEHARFLTAPEELFESEADVEAYAAHQLRAIEALLPKDGLARQALRLSPSYVHAIGALVQRLSLSPCYAARGHLRQLMEQRARLASLWLENQGVQLGADVHGRAAGKRLRVGLLVGDAIASSAGLGALSAISGLDRRRFETVLVATRLAGQPAATAQMEQYGLGRAERAVLLDGDLNAMIAAVRSESFDFLLFGNNLTAVTSTEFLLSLCRLARWQVAFNACRATTGSATMDFFVSSARLEAGGAGQDAYTERLVLLDGPAHVRAVPPFAADLGEARPSILRDDRELRLVSGANYLRLTPQARATWMRALAALPDATLSLYPFGPEGSSGYDTGRLARLLARDATAAGVQASRVRLLESFSSVAALRRFLGTMDVYLDSFPCSGLSSVLDALMAGIPAVTLAGDSLRSNRGASVLQETGFPEWVAPSPRGYLEIVHSLGTDARSLLSAKQRVHASMARGTRFFDDAWYSSQFGQMFEDISSGRLER